MAEARKVGAVIFREADEGYFEERRLRRHAGVWSLWALGVAAVISGDFSGSKFGLDAGGSGGCTTTGRAAFGWSAAVRPSGSSRGSTAAT